MRDIYLWWIGADAADSRVLSAVRSAVERTFGRTVHFWNGRDRPADAFDARRVRLADVDLFIPILTFVFGEAQLDGAAAVVSTARLRTNHGTSNMRLLISRLAKECVHELGHTFGLYHCHQFECVMRSSTYVEEIDLKRAGFCPACAERLAEVHA